jgi:hypothetical protein
VSEELDSKGHAGEAYRRLECRMERVGDAAVAGSRENSATLAFMGSGLACGVPE